MSEQAGTGQSHDSCPNCRAELRPGNAFCASCGEQVSEPDEPPDQERSASPPSENPFTSNNVPREGLLRALRRLGVAYSTFRGDGPKGTFGRASRRFKELSITYQVLVVALMVPVTLLLLVLLSPLTTVACAILLGVSLIGLIVRVGQRRSVRGWGFVTALSLVLALTFSVIANELYGGRPSGSSTAASNSAQDRGDASKGGAPIQAKEGPSPQLQQAMDFVLGNPSILSTFYPDALYSRGVYDESGNRTDKGRALAAEALGRALIFAVTGTPDVERSQPINSGKLSPQQRSAIEYRLYAIGLPISVDQALTWARSYQEDPQNWWRHT